MTHHITPPLSLAAFAQRYVEYFEREFDPKTEAYYRLFDSKEFPKECEALGFKKDCGHSFIEAYGQKAWTDTQCLASIIGQIIAPHLIGSAIFSKWRYFNHWAGSAPTDDNMHWFLLMFRRLLELA